MSTSAALSPAPAVPQFHKKEKKNPEYPDGEYGWNTIEFVVDSSNTARHRETELIHACWALMGVMDFFTPEMMDRHNGVSWRMVCFIAGAQFISPAGWSSADPWVEHQLLPVLVPLGLQVVLMGALERIHSEEEERFPDWELIAKSWQKQDEERIEEVVRLHEENLDLKNLIQDWEEWYEEKEEARQGEVIQIQEISSSPEVPTVEEVGTRL